MGSTARLDSIGRAQLLRATVQRAGLTACEQGRTGLYRDLLRNTPGGQVVQMVRAAGLDPSRKAGSSATEVVLQELILLGALNAARDGGTVYWLAATTPSADGRGSAGS